MARGFGTVRGVGATDKVVTTLTSHGTQRSYAAWIYRNGNGGGGFGHIFDKLSSGTGQVEKMFYDAAAGFYQFRRAWSSAANVVWSFTAPATGALRHIGFSYDASSTANDAVGYLDGVSQAITEFNGPPSGSVVSNADPYHLGNRGAGDRNWDGDLAEWAAWDTILTSPEWAALAKGVSPLLIRPASLVEYVPMLRDNVSLKRSAPTITGTAIQAHPPVIYPSRPHSVTVPAAVVGSTQPPRSMHQYRMRMAA